MCFPAWIEFGTTKPQVAQPTAEINGQKSVFGITQRSTQEPNISNSNKLTDAKLIPKVPSAQTNNEAERVVLSSRGYTGRNSCYTSATVSPSSNGVQQNEMPHDYIMHNVKDADELYRESSPGFDVLVDDELAQDQYFDVDQYGLQGDHERRNGDADHVMYHDSRGYDVRGELANQHPWYENRKSSDRLPRGEIL